MSIIDFLEKLLSLFENCPSEKSKNSKIKTLKDECLKCAKDYNDNLKNLEFTNHSSEND